MKKFRQNSKLWICILSLDNYFFIFLACATLISMYSEWLLLLLLFFKELYSIFLKCFPKQNWPMVTCKNAQNGERRFLIPWMDHGAIFRNSRYLKEYYDTILETSCDYSLWGCMVSWQHSLTLQDRTQSQEPHFRF